MFSLNRRTALAVCAGMLACASAWCQTPAAFPDKPIRMVLPFPPGGPTDIFARQYANGLSRVLGQNVVVDNKAGASGAIGSLEVKRATPDGHTLFFGTTGNLAINPVMYAKLPFDLTRDFAPVATLALMERRGASDRHLAATLAMVCAMAQANASLPMTAMGLKLGPLLLFSLVGGLAAAAAACFI